jgi:hypothetical protein
MAWVAIGSESWKLLLLISLCAMVPLLFALAAFQAWSCKLTGVTSLAAVYGLTGACGLIFSVFTLCFHFSSSRCFIFAGFGAITLASLGLSHIAKSRESP